MIAKAPFSTQESSVTKKAAGSSAAFLYAEGRIRTGTGLPPLPPQDSVSTNSTTSAWGRHLSTAGSYIIQIKTLVKLFSAIGQFRFFEYRLLSILYCGVKFTSRTAVLSPFMNTSAGSLSQVISSVLSTPLTTTV